MSRLVKPIRLGKLQLKNNIIYSPLAGCSDWPFRKMVARYGQPGLMYCEMVKMDAVVRNDANTFRLLDYSGDMHAIGAQLVGSKPTVAAQAARIVEGMGFDVIDFNCGCPVDKVTKECSGSGMLRHPEKIGEVIAAIVAAVDIPVTVKIRAGWDDDSIIAPEVTRIAEEAGAVAIAIHGRTRKQAYRGKAERNHIKACKEISNSILVLGNGDIFDPKSAEHMFEYTKCDGILVSRGTLGAPWIAQDIIAYDKGLPLRERNLEDRRKALLEHFECMLSYWTAKKAVIDMRRVGCWYFPKCAAARDFRRAISRVETVGEVRELINLFPEMAEEAVVAATAL